MVEKMAKPRIAITIGDPAGIGAEIAVKAVEGGSFAGRADIIIIGSACVLEDAIRMTHSSLALNVFHVLEKAELRIDAVNLLDLDNISSEQFTYGKVGKESGKASIEYIFKAIDFALSGKIDAVVTGPIHKEAINRAGYRYTGHTEIFADKTHTADYAMMLAEGNFRVIHVSTHVSLRRACDLVKRDRVYTVIKLAEHGLKRLGVKCPRIAVAGLNPHAGESGLFGNEELREIKPAIEQAAAEGIHAEGPFPPDTVFSKARGGQYDIVVVMYHDQGHIPMKTTGFQFDEKSGQWLSMSGVNVTLGLPIIRTSVDHGVAYGKAGKGRANPESMISAIDMAITLAS
jgi:4-hydroxythreonine-4-phosphate dehydrogenase